MQRGLILWASRHSDLCLHDWSPTVSLLGLPFPLNCCSCETTSSRLLLYRFCYQANSFGAHSLGLQKDLSHSGRLLSRLLHTFPAKGIEAHCCYFLQCEQRWPPMHLGVEINASTFKVLRLIIKAKRKS